MFTTFSTPAMRLFNMFDALATPAFRTLEETRFVTPDTNLAEDAEGYYVEVAVPGMTKSDFEVRLGKENDIIIATKQPAKATEAKASKETAVEAKVESKPAKRYHKREFGNIHFKLAYELPEDADKDNIRATVEDGILTVTIPRLPKVEDRNANRLIDIA